MAVKIHPSVDNGVKLGTKGFSGGTLICQCASDPVTVTLASDVAFNHACGCSKCWKPDRRGVLGGRGRRPRQALGHRERPTS